MFAVSIYNNKGGVGKSTLTVCLAEFLRTNLDKRVLVIDLDAQASSSCSLLGGQATREAIRLNKTLGRLTDRLLHSPRSVDLDQFLSIRPAADGRGATLQDIALLVPDKITNISVEESMKPRDVDVLRKRLRPLLEDRFDYVLLDMPGNVDYRNRLIVAGMVMSDFVLVPVEPSQIALGGLPDTFEFVDRSRKAGGNGRPQVVGMVCNKTDRREEQYRSKLPALGAAAKEGQLPDFFTNILPDTPKLETATDDTIDFTTLKEKFDTYYDNVRKVAKELDDRCQNFKFDHGPEPASAASYLRAMLNPFRRAKRRGKVKI